jgi:hypothetical protein
MKKPRSMVDFMHYLRRVFFGNYFYNVKHVMSHCTGLYGGLDLIATTLGIIQRVAVRPVAPGRLRQPTRTCFSHRQVCPDCEEKVGASI